MIVFGIDISKSKGQAWAACAGEMIMATGVEKNISLMMKNVPLRCDLLAWEKPFVGVNAAAALALSEVVGSLTTICEMCDYRFRIIPGAAWQEPIKRVLGLDNRPFGISDNDWKNLKYRKYRIYLNNFLSRHISIDSLTDDQVAACCIALYVARREKTSKLLKGVNHDRRKVS